MNKLFLYYHTLKYVKPIQIFRRLFRRFHKPTQNIVVLDRRTQSGKWTTVELKGQVLFANGECNFLNQKGCVRTADDWNNSEHSKLWLYNLHYFDDFVSSNRNRDLQLEWLNRWLEHNAESHGNGWEPYPISLRSVNWIKAFLGGMEASDKALESLASQVDYLSQDLEYHLLGNHLFVNAKALVYAGCFFSGAKADKWLSTGTDILLKEIEEQILNDGTNFELTPMYHAVILVDLLDLLNLSDAYPNIFPESLKEMLGTYLPKMMNVLQNMTHPDGRLGFFNDSTGGIAPSFNQIESYATKLGVDKTIEKTNELIDFNDSGYICYRDANITLMADLGSIGPDYIPGHAHADTLSFELSLFGKSVFVNSGISEYGLSAERLRQRKTQAHNTVSVNSKDSSVVWSGFRVAQRARILERSIDSGKQVFAASHDGFKRQGINTIHKRTWQISNNDISISDHIDGEFDTAVSHLHLEPSVIVDKVSSECLTLMFADKQVNVYFEGGNWSICDTTWHPAFGVSIKNKRIDIQFTQPTLTVKISWSNT